MREIKAKTGMEAWRRDEETGPRTKPFTLRFLVVDRHGQVANRRDCLDQRPRLRRRKARQAFERGNDGKRVRRLRARSKGPSRAEIQREESLRPRRPINSAAEPHGRTAAGRTGDGALVEFRSVVDAVRCAVEIQNAMVERLCPTSTPASYPVLAVSQPQRREPQRAGALAAPQCGAVRAAVGLAGEIPPEARERTPRITRARTLGASAVRVDPPTSLRSVRFSMVHTPEERQRAQRPGHSALTTGSNSAAVY